MFLLVWLSPEEGGGKVYMVAASRHCWGVRSGESDSELSLNRKLEGKVV